MGFGAILLNVAEPARRRGAYVVVLSSTTIAEFGNLSTMRESDRVNLLGRYPVADGPHRQALAGVPAQGTWP